MCMEFERRISNVMDKTISEFRQCADKPPFRLIQESKCLHESGFASGLATHIESRKDVGKFGFAQRLSQHVGNSGLRQRMRLHNERPVVLAIRVQCIKEALFQSKISFKQGD